MQQATALLERISVRSDLLKPLIALEAPLAPVHPIRDLLAHLTSTPVHAIYFPFLRFGCLHAARTAIAWAAMTKTRDARPGMLQDLLGYLTISWGGGTLVSMLLSTPPAWLLSPMPWGIYVAGYVLLVQSGLAESIARAPAVPLSLALALVDGLTRGVAISSMPALAPGMSWIAPVILGAIATCGGGWVAQGMGMHKAAWAAGVPSVLDGGVLGTLDVWGAMLGGLVYVALTQKHAALDGVRSLGLAMPKEYRVTDEYGDDLGIVDVGAARALVVILLTGLFAARSITELAVRWRARPSVKRDVRVSVTPAPEQKSVKASSPTTSAVVEKSPVEKVSSEAAPKPRKRKTRSKKSKSPAP